MKNTNQITNTQGSRLLFQVSNSAWTLSQISCPYEPPDGVPMGNKYSLEAVATELKSLLDKNVLFLKECVGPETEKAMPTQWLSLSSSWRASTSSWRKRRERCFWEQGSSGDRRNGCSPRFIVQRKGYLHQRRSGDCALSLQMVGVNSTEDWGFFVLFYFYEGAELLCQGLRESKMILAILGRAKVANKIQLINKCWTESMKIVIVGGLACTFFK